MFVCGECYVLSGRGLCDELISRPEESYRLWCVVMCDLETSNVRKPWPALGRSAIENKQTTAHVHFQLEANRTVLIIVPIFKRYCFPINSAVQSCDVYLTCSSVPLSLPLVHLSM